MARYIDADKLMEAIEKNIEPYKSWDCTKADVIMDTILDAHTADVVEVKHGEWIRNECNIEKMKEFHEKGIALSMSEKSIFYTCSCCGSWGTLTQKHCSECGAKMDGGKEDV